MKIPTAWSIYKKDRLSIQNSGATALAGEGILEGYLRQRAAPAAVLPFISRRVREDMNENLGFTLKATADQDGDAMELNPHPPAEHLKPYICELE
jgi:hypothetical protein